MNRRAFVRYLPFLPILAATDESVAKGLRVHTPVESVEVWTPGWIGREPRRNYFRAYNRTLWRMEEDGTWVNVGSEFG